MDLMYLGAITFRLGGYYRESSLAEFAWRVGLYSLDEVMSPQCASLYQVTK